MRGPTPQWGWHEVASPWCSAVDDRALVIVLCCEGVRMDRWGGEEGDFIAVLKQTVYVCGIVAKASACGKL
jgi:hypothetical protein